MLNIKPVLTCDEREGKYVIEKKPRGWQKALKTQVDLIAEQAARWSQVELISCGISADLLVHTGPTLVGMAVMGM